VWTSAAGLNLERLENEKTLEKTMKNPLDFTGKVALVTGAASGMGLAAAQAFAEAGAAVVMADYSNSKVRSPNIGRLSRAGLFRLGIRGRFRDILFAFLSHTVPVFREGAPWALR
jgi:hypothetical protein